MSVTETTIFEEEYNCQSEWLESRDYLIKHEYHPVTLSDHSGENIIFVVADNVPLVIAPGWSDEWKLFYGMVFRDGQNSCTVGFNGGLSRALDNDGVKEMIAFEKSIIFDHRKENYEYPEMSDVFCLDTEMEEFRTQLNRLLDDYVFRGWEIQRY